MDVVLIPGMWLPGSVWEPVTDRLGSRGHRATPLTLPGQGDGDSVVQGLGDALHTLAAVGRVAGVVDGFRDGSVGSEVVSA